MRLQWVYCLHVIMQQCMKDSSAVLPTHNHSTVNTHTHTHTHTANLCIRDDGPPLPAIPIGFHTPFRKSDKVVGGSGEEEQDEQDGDDQGLALVHPLGVQNVLAHLRCKYLGGGGGGGGGQEERERERRH